MKVLSFAVFMVFALAMSGCATTSGYEGPGSTTVQKGYKSSIGSAIGAVAGAVIGYKLGQGQADKKLAIITGTAIASFIGHHVGRHLDKRDQQRHSKALQEAFDAGVGSQQAWRNKKTGSRGKVQTVSTRHKEGVECKEVESVITTRHGMDKQVVTGCRDKDGGWTLAG